MMKKRILLLLIVSVIFNGVSGQGITFGKTRKFVSDSLSQIGYSLLKTITGDDGRLYDEYSYKQYHIPMLVVGINRRGVVYKYMEMSVTSQYEESVSIFNKYWIQVDDTHWRLPGQPIFVEVYRGGGNSGLMSITYYTDPNDD